MVFTTSGNGKGFSVKKVWKNQKGNERKLRLCVEGRRAGDPSTLIATSDKAMKELGWKPRFNTLTQIIETAWKWHQSHPNGYDDK